MFGYQIIQELAGVLTGEEVIISSNGNISRQVYHFLPRPQIYLRGSMGLAVPVGLGVALAKPMKKVLVIVGDGNLLMGLGSLATTAYLRPRNMRILILDNNEYATTGHQQTASGILDYPQLLKGLGMPYIEPIKIEESIEEMRTKLERLMQTDDLCALPSIIGNESPTLSNIPWHPEKIAALQKQREN
ncbi:MAG: thiamine pyrophosphate-dependent enzyme [Candidatus Thorarchaeota archaeon]